MAAESADGGRRVVVWLVSLVALGMLAATGLLIVSLERSLDRVDVTGLGEAPGTDDEDDGADPAIDGDAPEAITVLVLGSDTRQVLTPEERRELGTGDAWGERTESIALLRLDPEADTLRMLNVPRDTLLTRCDGSRGRVNAAYQIGEQEGTGALSCVVETLTTWGGITIDHAVKVDFRGFVDIVDAVGGVPMTLDEPIRDRRANLDLPAGCTRLDGATALAFVRARSIDSDFGRIERQQRFVEELRTEIGELGILRDLPQLYRTASAAARAAELDQELTLPRIQQLARQYRQTLELPVQGRSIPGATEMINGMAFLRVDEDDARAGFRWLEQGGTLPGDAYDEAVGEPDEPIAGTTRPGTEDDGSTAPGDADDAPADDAPADDAPADPDGSGRDPDVPRC